MDLGSVLEAQVRIREHIRETPVLEAYAYDLASVRVAIKLESLQHTGSFKARGAFNSILQLTKGTRLVAASGGNHGAAVAFAASKLGFAADIFVPSLAAPTKIERLRSLGANITIIEGAYADAARASHAFAVETGAVQVPAYDDADVIAGQGTIALEFINQAGFDTLLVAVGGGGLASGCALALPANLKLVTVETEGASCFFQARAAGKPVTTAVGGVAADSLGASEVGALCYETLMKRGVESVVVSDDEVVRAQRRLWRTLRIASEPGGAVAAAALLSGAYTPLVDERVGFFICGANVDPAILEATSVQQEGAR